MSTQPIDPQYRSEDGSALRIWRDAAPNNFLTQREGIPIFDAVIFVEVISPGSANSSPIFEVLRTFDERMGQNEPLKGAKYAEYEKYIKDFESNAQASIGMAGTPLDQWSALDVRRIASLKAQGIFTLDGLAAMPDTALIKLGPDGRTLREQAKAYLDNAKDGSATARLAAELEIANTDKAALQQQVVDLSGRIAALEAAQNGGPVPASTQSITADPLSFADPLVTAQPDTAII